MEPAHSLGSKKHKELEDSKKLFAIGRYQPLIHNHRFKFNFCIALKNEIIIQVNLIYRIP